MASDVRPFCVKGRTTWCLADLLLVVPPHSKCQPREHSTNKHMGSGLIPSYKKLPVKNEWLLILMRLLLRAGERDASTPKHKGSRKIREIRFHPFVGKLAYLDRSPMDKGIRLQTQQTPVIWAVHTLCLLRKSKRNLKLNV